MPGMGGLQLLGEIKQRLPDLPVMMVTALVMTSDGGKRPSVAQQTSLPSRSTLSA
jgi:CheY-like chemotaxis protein